MTLSEAKREITGLRERYGAPYNSTDKDLIERLYWDVLGKVFKPTSCQTCYHDAVIEIYLQLKNHNSMAAERNYLLKAGAIINSPVFDNGKIYSNANLTDDVAKRYLDMFPESVGLFQRLPEKTAEKPRKTAKETDDAANVDNVSTKAAKRAQKGNKTAKTGKS